MNRRRLALATLAAAGVLALAGCGDKSPSTPANAAPAADPSAPASASAAPEGSTSPSAGGKSSGKPSARPSGSAQKSAGALPDPCQLFTKADVQQFTGKQVTQLDKDGGSGEGVRYCQWQLSGGRLVVALSKTTPADFKTRAPSAKPVTGLGDDAYTDSGHLYVREGTLQVDVYYTGGSDAANLAVAKAVAKATLARA